jgi:pyruvate dehydrogenase E2 component (dihydrolipoamide acetyltransferase)
MSEFDSPFTAQSDEHRDADDEVEGHTADLLSPSVRRLIRQYDVDIAGIHGSGPQGRIRVGDVMAAIGGRTHVPAEDSQRAVRELRTTPPALARAMIAADSDSPTADRSMPTTCIFECDMMRVLAHQKLMREQGQEVALTAYFVFACTAALNLLRERQADDDPAHVGVSMTTPAGGTAAAIVRDARDKPFAAINEQLSALLSRTGTGAQPESIDDAALAIHHHGLGGSILAFPTPLNGVQTASLGIGAIRRVVAVRNVNGEDAARIAAQCYLSLSFSADRIELPQANAFLSECVRTLEHWPVKRAG